MIDCGIAECQATIHAGLARIIEQDFSYQKKRFSYTRKRKPCTDEFRVELHKMTGWYVVAPSVFVICREVNKLYNTILNVKSPLGRATFGFGIDNRFTRQRGRYHIDEVADFRDVTKAIEADFFDVGLPWFARIYDSQSIDAHINSRDSTGEYHPLSVSQACKGLIAAHLADNPAFDDIAEAYYRFCCNAQSPVLAEPILETRNYLKPQR